MATASHYFTRDVPMGDITDANSVLPNMNNGMAIAKFFTHSVKDEALTASRGRYSSREIEMVRIIIPGDKHNVVERRVRPNDQEKYPREYEAFRKMQDFVPDGTLLSNWGLISRSQCEDLRYQNIFTVEQLAALSDENLPALGLGSRKLREHAKQFLKTSETGRVPAQLVEENDKLRSSVEMLTKQIEQLSRRFESMASKAGRDTSEMDSPVIEARAAAAAAQPGPTAVIIPDDYNSLSLTALRALCKKFTETPVVSKADAFELIEEYKAG